MGIEPEIEKIRVKVLGIPVDIVKPEQLEPLVFKLLEKKEPQNIILLSLWDLLKAKYNSEYRGYVQRAAMVIPISKSLVSGARFLNGKKPLRYMPFDFVISLLNILESRNLSLYLLGGKRNVLLKTEKNISQTFPRLRIVGRYIGAFKRTDENDIIEAIRKSSPSLLLTGKGIRGSELWIARNSQKIGNGLRLWCSDLFDVFAEKKKRPSRGAFDAGLEWIGYTFQKPWKFFRFFLYVYYLILLLIYKIFSL